MSCAQTAMKSVAVVGGGIFGVTAAVHLARAGHRVVLFERTTDLLTAASSTNQRRLHRGYHYPRSMATASAVRDGVLSFAEEYGEAMVAGNTHHVAIAKHGSMVSASKYLAFCDHFGLWYTEDHPPFLRRDTVEVALRVEECAIDVPRLRRLCWRRLADADVEVRLRTPRRLDQLSGFDQVVLATYARLNDLQAAVPGAACPYQFEVCEKPLVRLPPQYRRSSVVILDGPFLCIDPVGPSDRHLIGNVVHAVHATTVGLYPLTPAHLRGLIDTGLHRRPESTRFDAFVTDARRFFLDFTARHIGSYFTLRTVLPGVERTDARPTLVRPLNDRVASVFSGKISTCVEAARRLVRLVEPSTTQQGWRTDGAGPRQFLSGQRGKG